MDSAPLGPHGQPGVTRQGLEWFFVGHRQAFQFYLGQIKSCELIGALNRREVNLFCKASLLLPSLIVRTKWEQYGGTKECFILLSNGTVGNS